MQCTIDCLCFNYADCPISILCINPSPLKTECSYCSYVHTLRYHCWVSCSFRGNRMAVSACFLTENPVLGMHMNAFEGSVLALAPVVRFTGR